MDGYERLTLSLDAIEALELQAGVVLSCLKAVERSGRAWTRCPRYSEPWVRSLTTYARAQQRLDRELAEWRELYQLCAHLVTTQSCPDPLEWPLPPPGAP